MEAVHRAESAVARRDWPEAYWAARVAQTVTGRTFLPGEDAPWIEEIRRSLEDVRMRTLECLAEAALEVGGTEVATSERTARTLIKEAPYREGAYRLLMRSLAARGEIADVVRLYEELRSRLRDDLGVVPAAATRDLYRTLVHAGADDGRVEPEVRSRTQ
jgi:DNA-binding SARP family transcriptional activator